MYFIRFYKILKANNFEGEGSLENFPFEKYLLIVLDKGDTICD
jgi:hypothetical protein